MSDDMELFSTSKGTILGEELRQMVQADRRDAARFRALEKGADVLIADTISAFYLVEITKNPTGLAENVTLAEVADALIAQQTQPPKTE